MSLSGGCCCGAVRYETSERVFNKTICHCRTCRRAAGAANVAWLSVALADYTVTAGTPGQFHSSDAVIRTFCQACGTQLTFNYTEGPETVDVTLATLDDPNAVAPQHHSWCAAAVPALDASADLPRYAEGGSDLRKAQTR